MNQNYSVRYLVILLIVLIVILITLFSFSVYESLKGKGAKEEAKERYTVEEVVEPEDIKPDETAEVPIMEETEEEVTMLNEVIIEIQNLRFEPNSITISPGTTVTWLNNDSSPHKVVAYDRVFYGPRLNPGDKYSFTFTKEGTHRYFDAVFPKIGRGNIIVKEEPLPITGGVIGVDLSKEGGNGKFALLVLLFIIMVFGLSHGIYRSYKI